MQKLKSLFLKSALAVALALIAFYGSQNWLKKPDEPQQLKLSAIAADEGYAARRSSTRKAVPGLSDSVLIDSILTIVQNYYVDSSRVENRKLIEETLKSLEVQDTVRLSFPSADNWVVKKGQDTLAFDLSGSYSFDALVKDCMRLARFLDRHPSENEKSKAKESGARMVVSALLAGLDPHSNLLDPEEYRDLRQGTEGSFGGLGVVVGMQEDVLTVVKPLPKSPASRAGVNKSDRIMSIDDKKTFGTTLDDLIQYMRGEPGTKVRLSLLREGDMAPRDIFLTREVIQVDSVEWKLLPAGKGKLFYAYIDSFSSRTANELRDALVKAQQTKEPILGVILDMRSNPGGLLDQAVKVADLFLEEGKIVTTQGRTRESDSAKRNLLHFDYPITVLTNGDTASASEIVAGALKDQGRALVIGEPSFGKGSVQTVFELPGEQALKLTIARYYTPKGISIQNIGISPDIWLQPIAKNASNLNLLGDYRYKSERFLDHSLDQEKVKTAAQGKSAKAFYLMPEGDKGKDFDLPLEFASKLLVELSRREGYPFPVERLRASYWRASSDGFIKKTMADLDRSTTDWLKKQQKVDWTALPERAGDENGLQFAVQMPRRSAVAEGKTLDVPYMIKNSSSRPLSRVSVYLSAVTSSLGTNEVLIGRINPGQTLKGTLKMDMKLSAEEGPVRMRAGIAKSGWPLPGRDKEFLIELQSRTKPQFDKSMSLTHEEGGQQPGVLEPMEMARIRVVVKNSSNVAARNVALKLVNLSGKQVNLDDKSVPVGDMKAGESRAVFVRVQGSAQILSEDLNFGALVDSDDLVMPSKTHFALPSVPRARVSKSDVLTGTGVWKEN